MQRVRGPKHAIYQKFTFREIMCVSTTACGRLTPRLRALLFVCCPHLEYCIPTLRYHSHDGWLAGAFQPHPHADFYVSGGASGHTTILPQIQTHAFVTRFQATQKWGGWGGGLDHLLSASYKTTRFFGFCPCQLSLKVSLVYPRFL